MARIAIISDVHANIEALNLILKDIEKRNVDKIVCLGDLVTKYFYPKEVVDAIRSNCDIVIKGNCDNLVATDSRYKYARGQLGIDRIEYLDNLPRKEQIIVNKALVNLYHSTPDDLEAIFNPIFNDNAHTKYKDRVLNDYNKMFIGSIPQTSIVGHTHQNYIGIEKNKHLDIVEGPIIVTNKDKVIVNAGSAGEHNYLVRNNENSYDPMIDPYLTYAIIDDKNLDNGFQTQIVKVPYRHTLKSVYFDMEKGQDEKRFPYSPKDTKKVHDSLVEMGELTEEGEKKAR